VLLLLDQADQALPAGVGSEDGLLARDQPPAEVLARVRRSLETVRGSETSPRVQAEVVASGDQVWLLDPLTGSLRAMSGMGNERVTGRLPVARSRLATAQVAALREAAMTNARRAMDSARVRAQYDPGTAPDEAPWFSSAIAGWDGGVWVRLFPGELGRECRHLILDANGKAVSWTCIPPDVRVEQVGSDFLLGVRTDSVGLESVVLFAIPRQL
jgi:hypothetical protein